MNTCIDQGGNDKTVPLLEIGIWNVEELGILTLCHYKQQVGELELMVVNILL